MEDIPRTNNSDDSAGGGWIMTFADLMSLLMCFFVLLLSFSELDLMKFKAIAGSMRLAFGVQREIRATEIPKGTSIIAQEFSPGKPEPTPINEVRQSTMDENKQTLEFTDAYVTEEQASDTRDTDGAGSDADEEEEAATRAEAAKLMEALKEEVDKGMIQIETQGVSIVVRIREKGSFPSGTAQFRSDFLPVVEKLRRTLDDVQGTIVVAGHTDNIPIKTARFRSNWDLSAARAVSVVHELLEDGALAPDRFLVEGHGDAHPLVPNDSSDNRALNRRVEITIQRQGRSTVVGEEIIGAVSTDDEVSVPVVESPIVPGAAVASGAAIATAAAPAPMTQPAVAPTASGDADSLDALIEKMRALKASEGAPAAPASAPGAG